MGVRGKTFLTILLVGIAVAAVSIGVQNKELFKGQIFNQPDQEEDVVENGVQTALPDLKPELEVMAPESEQTDITINATIQNVGEGAITGGVPFIYTLYMNDVEVLSNSDSYSTIEPGDSFSFTYPIPRSIYNYSNQGTVKFVLDTQDAIKETDESNNEITQEFNF